MLFIIIKIVIYYSTRFQCTYDDGQAKTYELILKIKQTNHLYTKQQRKYQRTLLKKKKNVANTLMYGSYCWTYVCCCRI